MASRHDTIFLNHPVDEVLRATVEALQFIGAEVEEIDDDAQVITGMIGFNLRSWGERISVRVDAVSEMGSAIRIESRERFGFQLIDWGKNANNIDAFEAALRDLLENPSPDSVE